MEGDIVYNVITMGAIFCTVINVKHLPQDKPCIIVGNQKCKGAAPIFRNSPSKIPFSGRFSIKVALVALIRRTIDPMAWIKKYFKLLSEE